MVSKIQIQYSNQERCNNKNNTFTKLSIRTIMQKITTFLFLILFSCFIYSQTVNTANDLLKANKLVEAKNEIDKVLGSPANQKNYEAYYTKAKICNAIVADPQLRKQYPAARMDAFNALKRYTETDEKMLVTLRSDGYKPIKDIYAGFYTEAAAAYKINDYEAAFTGFVNAISVINFMTEKGWIKVNLDTSSVLYAGLSAERSARNDEAAYYYGQLVKARVTIKGYADMVEIYKWTAKHHFEKKNYSEATVFINIGKEVYPDIPFWPALEIALIGVSGSSDELFGKYEEVIAKYPTNHFYRYNYAVELYEYAYNTDQTKRPANSDELIKKVEQNLASAIRIEPDYTKAQLFAGQVVYNKGIDELQTTKAKALEYFDEATPYFLQVEKLSARKTNLTPGEKSDLKEAYDLLTTIYKQKNLAEKATEYKKKFNSLNK